MNNAGAGQHAGIQNQNQPTGAPSQQAITVTKLLTELREELTKTRVELKETSEELGKSQSLFKSDLSEVLKEFFKEKNYSPENDISKKHEELRVKNEKSDREIRQLQQDLLDKDEKYNEEIKKLEANQKKELEQEKSNLREIQDQLQKEREKVARLEHEHNTTVAELNACNISEKSRANQLQTERDNAIIAQEGANGLEKHMWPAWMNESPFEEVKQFMMQELSGESVSVGTLALLAALFRYRSIPSYDSTQPSTVSTYAVVAYDLSRAFMEYFRNLPDYAPDNHRLLAMYQDLAGKLRDGAGGDIAIEVPVIGQPFDNLRMIQRGKPSNTTSLKVSRVLSWAVMRQGMTLHKAEVEA